MHRPLMHLAASALLCVGGPVSAAQDWQTWTNVSAQGALDGNLLGLAEVSLRWVDDASRLGVSDTKVALGWRASESLQLYLGYGHIRATALGRTAVEHRPFQQASYTLVRGRHATLSGRTRFEQRFVEDLEMALRLRQQMRFVVPLGGRHAPAFTTAGELFWTVKGAGETGEEFDQVRGSVALRFPVAPALTFDAGYQVQNRTTPQRRNDILLLAANWSF